MDDRHPLCLMYDTLNFDVKVHVKVSKLPFFVWPSQMRSMPEYNRLAKNISLAIIVASYLHLVLLVCGRSNEKFPRVIFLTLLFEA